MSRLRSFLLTLFLISVPFSGFADDGAAHHEHHSHDMQHAHNMLEIPEGSAVPQVELHVTPDTKSGWNLHLITQNFQFAPEHLDQADTYQFSEGHAHLYVNGQKITRLYAPWYYFPRLVSGTYNITVTLNTNGHQDLMYQGQRIEATVQLSVP